MRRGFSLIELLIALMLITNAIIAAALVSYGAPRMMQNAYLELGGVDRAQAALIHAELLARDRFNAVESIATTSENGYDLGLRVESTDDLTKRLISSVSWVDAGGVIQSFNYETTVTDYSNAALHPCDPFLSGDWKMPHVIDSYSLSPGALLPTTLPSGAYSISALSIRAGVLAIAVSTTTRATDPTLFFFDISSSSTAPRFLPPAFDNASVSRSGYTALAANPDGFFAANGFGSASAATCAHDELTCAQVHSFRVMNGVPERSDSLRIPTTSPERAITTSGAGAAGAALAYREDGYLYLGLQKTTAGQELQSIDVHDPSALRRIGGMAIGRSVNDITIATSTAYIATDDNTSSGKAVVAVDSTDPTTLYELGSYRFPGAGYVQKVNRIGSRLYTGRSYALGTSEEFSILDRSDSHTLTRLGGIDLGTAHSPQSVRGIIVRDFLAFVLTDSSLQLWNITNPNISASTQPYASIPIPSGTGTAFACRGNLMYIGSVDSSGAGYLSVVSSM
jgi:prepilin-type N-terminal cleavage/methylation domain-containing protein